jgi:glycosyltransferase involved in cell wall biosynthesis
LEKITTLQLDGNIHKLTTDHNPFDLSIATENRCVVVIFFPHNPAYRRTGAHQAILLRILAMLEFGAKITFISTVSFTDTPWDDWSINYLLSLGISRVEVIQDAIVDIEHRSINREAWSSRCFEAYTPPYLTLRVKQILSEVRPECFYISYAYWAELSKVNNEIGSRNILDLHDFLGRAAKLAKDATNTGNSFANLLPAEIYAFTKVNKIIAVSLPDFNQLKDIYRPNTLSYLPVAPKTKPRHANISTKDKRKFVFVGSQNNINRTSMMLFIKEALPLILGLNNEFELELYGPICEYVPKVKGINICGWQPEEIIYNMNTVLLSPLISATGMQVKIAEAFSNAAPVICYSSIAFQNEVVDEYNGIVAQNPDGLSRACLRLQLNDDLFERCQNGAEETSNRRYEHFRASLRDILFETSI